MNFDTIILNNALLGTTKKTISENEIEPALHQFYSQIYNSNADLEDKFLQFAALNFNYKKCGIKASKKDGVEINIAPAEDKHYCSLLAHQVLKNIIIINNFLLLKLWMDKCIQSNKVVYPEILPVLFNLSLVNKELFIQVFLCGGKRAEWLSNLNPLWHRKKDISEQEIWETGTLSQRLELLLEVRKVNHEKAMEWVKSTWSQENAANKTEFLKTLFVNISHNEAEWFSLQLQDKSLKVKEQLWLLLKFIPESFIVQKYIGLIKATISYKKQKSLFGLIQKKDIQILLAETIDEDIFRSGVEKLSSDKNITDEEFIIYQVLQFTPLSVLESIFELEPKQILNQLKESEFGNKMLPAIAWSIGVFKNSTWAVAFAENIQGFFPPVAQNLTPAIQEKYLINNFIGSEEEILRFSTSFINNPGDELVKTILQYTAKNPYQYNKQFYEKNILFFPVSAMNDIRLMQVDGLMQINFENIKEQILSLLSLKSEIIKSFPV